MRSSGDINAKKLEQLVYAATERIVEAIERRELFSAQPTTDPRRVDMREQVTSQAPKLAVGYRLVLPARREGDPARLSPKRSRTRGFAWYSLTPFEFPDDIRLLDGCWHRIVWVDGQGQRIRMQPGEPVPGLFYFIGPAQPQSDAASTGSKADDSVARSPNAAPSPTTTTATPPPQSAVQSFENNLLAPLLSPEFLEAFANDIAAQMAEEQKNVLATTGMSAQAIDKKSSPLLALPPQLVAEIPENMRSVLDTMAGLTVETSRLVVRFVQQPEWMLQLLYEERLAEARTRGGPLPKPPPTGLSSDERRLIHDALTKRVPESFVALCKLIHAFARKYGLEVLDCLPTPLPPLPDAERQRLQSAISTPRQAAYLHYVYTWQESQMRSLPLPQEPDIALSSKERNQLRRMMRDLRAVIFFEKQVRPPLSFLQR